MSHKLCLTASVLLAIIAASNVAQAQQKKVVCYFSSWATYRYGSGFYDVESIDPMLCTHLMFGFAGIDPQTYEIKVLDPYNELYDNWGKGAYDRFTNLKNLNPNLKTLLAIGGWNEGSTHYSEMAETPERRKTFIDSVVKLLFEHNFDGLDLDWEYPGGRDDSPGSPEDREKYTLLLKEMRAEFDLHGYMLTAAVSAGQEHIDEGYDVPAMMEALDFISVMTYDYHGWFPNHTFTGHNAPMYSLPFEDADPEHPGYHFNMNFSINYWLSKGAPKEKMVMGLPTYGRGFTLADPTKHGLYDTANNGIEPGMYTQTWGYWGYNELCEILYVKGELDQWTFVTEDQVNAPYGYNGVKWFSFDDIASITAKSQYILDMDLAGAMVWSLDTDDFQGFCGQGPNPLLNTIELVLNGAIPTLPPGYTTPKPPTTTTTGPTIPPDGVCDGSGMLQPDPEDCHSYLECIPEADGWSVLKVTCTPADLVFSYDIQACVWPEQAPEVEC